MLRLRRKREREAVKLARVLVSLDRAAVDRRGWRAPPASRPASLSRV
jgi:hypothetical protein